MPGATDALRKRHGKPCEPPEAARHAGVESEWPSSTPAHTGAPRRRAVDPGRTQLTSLCENKERNRKASLQAVYGPAPRSPRTNMPRRPNVILRGRRRHPRGYVGRAGFADANDAWCGGRGAPGLACSSLMRPFSLVSCAARLDLVNSKTADMMFAEES